MKVTILFLICFFGLASNAVLRAQSHWSEVSVFEKINPRSIYFISQDSGYLIRSGIPLQTIDGGSSWSHIALPSDLDSQDVTFSSISFATSQVGYLAGQLYTWNRGQPTAHSIFLRTTDSGNSWTTINVDSMATVDRLDFPSASVGYFTSFSGGIGKSTDSGKTWTVNYPPVDTNYSRIKFRDETHGMFVHSESHGEDSGFDSVQYSFDGLKSWKGTASGIALAYLQDKEWLTGSHTVVQRTTDDGSTWYSSYLPAIPNCQCWLRDFAFHKLSGFALTDAAVGYLWRSTDGGVVWGRQKFEDNYSVESINVVSDSVAFILAFSKTINKYVLLKTTDGGGPATYASVATPEQSELTVAPNPTANQITLYGLPDDIQRIEVMNVVGVKVLDNALSRPLPQAGAEYAFDIASLPAGMYVVRVVMNSGSINRTFVKE